MSDDTTALVGAIACMIGGLGMIVAGFGSGAPARVLLGLVAFVAGAVLLVAGLN